MFPLVAGPPPHASSVALAGKAPALPGSRSQSPQDALAAAGSPRGYPGHRDASWLILGLLEGKGSGGKEHVSGATGSWQFLISQYS
jgi:hypothetical protein